MTIQDELQRLFDEYVAAYRVGNAAGCAAIFTPNAELYSPYGPASRGRGAIEETHAAWTQAGGENKQIEVIEAGQSGNLAWCLARCSEGDATGDGTSLNVLERQEDGGWSIRMCSLNEDR